MFWRKILAWRGLLAVVSCVVWCGVFGVAWGGGYVVVRSLVAGFRLTWGATFGNILVCLQPLCLRERLP